MTCSCSASPACFLAAHFALWITSLSHTSVASSVLFVTTTPVFVAVAGHFLLADRVGWLTALAVVVSIAGGVIIAAGDWAEGERRLYGDALAIGGAIVVAGYLLIGRRVRATIPTLPYIAIVYAAAAVALFVAAVASGQQMLGLPMESYFLDGGCGARAPGHRTFPHQLGAGVLAGGKHYTSCAS